jgi:hypothetical protein
VLCGACPRCRSPGGSARCSGGGAWGRVLGVGVRGVRLGGWGGGEAGLLGSGLGGEDKTRLVGRVG